MIFSRMISQFTSTERTFETRFMVLLPLRLNNFISWEEFFVAYSTSTTIIRIWHYPRSVYSCFIFFLEIIIFLVRSWVKTTKDPRCIENNSLCIVAVAGSGVLLVVIRTARRRRLGSSSSFHRLFRWRTLTGIAVTILDVSNRVSDAPLRWIL